MPEKVLIREILKMSKAKTFAQACLEWDLADIWIDEEVDSTCLCEHHPIKEVCVISNRVTGQKTEVGNCCVNKFMGLGSANLFASLKRVVADETKSFNPDMIHYVQGLSIISLKEAKFYLDIWLKRELTERQAKWKNDINQKILRFHRRVRERRSNNQPEKP